MHAPRQPPVRDLASGPWLRLHRPLQWTKNAVVLSALVFGGRAGDPQDVGRALGAVLAFCAISSAGYIWNDIWDRDRDRLHPDKRDRPIASGCIAPRAALLWSVILLTGALALGGLLSPALVWIEAAYVVLMGAYTIRLKHLPLLDVAVIAAGFVLRAMAGAVAVDVPMSAWLLVCTFLLALILGFGKRRHELVALGAMAARHRPALAGYSRRVLDGLIVASAALALIAYFTYAATTPTVSTNWPMQLTVPFVAFAIGRYLFLVFRRNLGGSPEKVLVLDRPLQVALVGWALAIALALLGFQATG